MRRFLPLVSLLCLAVSACGRSGSESETGIKPEKTGGPLANPATAAADFTDFVVGEPVRIRNLTVFPISSKTLRDADRFITLEEGLRAGTIEIFEVGAQLGTQVADGRAGNVNRHVAANQESQVSTSGEDAEALEAADELVAFNGAADVNHLMVVNRRGTTLV